MTRTHVIAPKELIKEVDQLVGPRRRSDFIAAAVDEKLKREKLLRVVRHAAKLKFDSFDGACGREMAEFCGFRGAWSENWPEM